MAEAVNNPQEDLNKIDSKENSDLAVLTKEIWELLNENNTDDWLESLSWSLTSWLSEYLKTKPDTVNVLLNVLDSLPDQFVGMQEIAKLKAFLQPLQQKDWKIDDPDWNILEVKLQLDSNVQSILFSEIKELNRKVTDSGLKNTLSQIHQIVANPTKRNFDQLSKFLDKNNIPNNSLTVENPHYVITVVNRLKWFMQEINTQLDNQNSVIEENDDERKNENKAYNELMLYIPWDLKKLNKMSDKDLRRLDEFIKRPNNQQKVFDLYYKMKHEVPNLNSKWMDFKDEEKFNNILGLIENKYKDSTELHEFELGKVFDGVESKSWSLNDFLNNNFNKTDWNWENLNSDFDVSKISGKYNFSKEEFIGKFNDLNAERTSLNNQKVSGIDVSSLFNDENLKFFAVESVSTTGWEEGILIKYEWNDFNEDKMMEIFGEGIASLVSGTSPDFVNDIERDWCINDNKIFGKVVKYIAEHQPEEPDEPDEQPTNDVIDWKLEDFGLIEQVDTQINTALQNRNIEWKFYEKSKWEDWNDTIKYNMNVIKQYLEAVKDKTYKWWWEDFRAITMAFQIALKYGDFDKKYDDLWKIDWLFYRIDWKPSKTRTQIKEFQKDRWFEWKDLDWKPGPKTIKALLSVLNGETPSIEEWDDNSSDNTGDNSDN